MDSVTAAKLANFLSDANEQLGLAVRLLKDSCNEEEFEAWRHRLANVIGALFLDGLDPLYREHAKLIPEALRDHYSLQSTPEPEKKKRRRHPKSTER